MQKYYIKTFGCQMNVHESEKLAGVLKNLNYLPVDNMEGADVIVFNTCAIRDTAEQKIMGNIGALKHLKKSHTNLIIAICGCMTQQAGKVELFKAKYPFVNIVFGTHNLHKFKDYLIEHKQNNKNIYEVWSQETDICENFDIYRTSNNNAWVNIMYGCNNFCTYCIVPYVRGRERSRKLDDIVNEVKGLIDDGYKYITLLGQNVNSYGKDSNNGINFSTLLNALAALDGDFRIKFMTSHPKDLSEEVIKTIANNEKISKSIHLPVQSGSNRVLKLMNRGYTIEHYNNLIDLIKTYIPNYFISTDIIVGFPQETEEDFMQTYNFVKEVDFGGVFAFMYSARKGTGAEKYDGQIAQEVKNKRVNKLLLLSKNIIQKQNEMLIGKALEGLIESKIDENNYLAVLDNGKSVYVNYSGDLQLPTFKHLKITGINKNKLTAVLAEEEN